MCKHFTEHFSLSIIFSIFFFSSIIQAQVDTLWTRTFGGNYHDYGYSVQQTTDEGYIIAGSTASFGAGSRDIWLIKTNSDGDTLWTKTFGGGDNEEGYSVHQTTDEGYIIVGYTRSFGTGYSDIWLIKTNTNGDTLWTKKFEGVISDIGYSVQQTTDEGYIITGLTYSSGFDIWLIKTNADGNTLWTKTFGGSGVESGYSVQQTIDEGYIITGETSSLGVGWFDVWLIKTNAVGDTLWTKTFGGGDNEHGQSVQQTIDEGYIIVGTTNSFGAGIEDIWLIKTNAVGDTLWTKTFGGSGYEEGGSVQQTTDEGYIIAGRTTSYGGTDVWLIKTNTSGDTLWTKTFRGSSNEFGYSVQQITHGGYIIAGSTYSFGAGGDDVWLIKTTPEVKTIEKTYINTPLDYTLSQNFPNPFNPKTTFKYYIPNSDHVTISIYTIPGQIIESETMNLNPGSYSYEFDGTQCSTGIYFYKISTSSGFTAERKMVLLK